MLLDNGKHNYAIKIKNYILFTKVIHIKHKIIGQQNFPFEFEL